VNLTRQAVQRGDEQHGTAAAAMFHRGFELRPILMPLAALDICIFSDEFPGTDMA
jgi:hypothetical protein